MKGSGGKNQRHAGGENAGRDARGQKASLHPRGVRLRLPPSGAAAAHALASTSLDPPALPPPCRHSLSRELGCDTAPNTPDLARERSMVADPSCTTLPAEQA